jgi:PAS domain S-box-containing protein
METDTVMEAKSGVKSGALPDQILVAAFMASIPDHVYFKDRESRFLALSSSIAHALGCRVDDMLGKTDYDFYDEVDARGYQEAELKVMNSGEPLIDHLVKVNLPDGRENWLLKIIIPMRDEADEIVGVFGTCKDITATKRMEQELEKVNRDLRAMSRTAGMAEIANNVLHNVGNVLNSVNVSASLIGDKVRDSKAKSLDRAVQLMNEHTADLGAFFTADAKGRALPGYLNKLVLALAGERESITAELASLTRSIEHIKDIVATQQAYAGATTLLGSAQIKDLLEDALRINAASIQRHQIEIIKDFADVPLLQLDKHLVLQILVNLIGNAKNAMDGVPGRPHHITLKVRIVAADDSSRLTISVEDDGEGIAAENLPRLFAHGFTTRRNGHGFGLHSCALAAKEMGGSITAESSGPGRGAVFTLTLPVNQPKGP